MDSYEHPYTVKRRKVHGKRLTIVGVDHSYIPTDKGEVDFFYDLVDSHDAMVFERTKNLKPYHFFGFLAERAREQDKPLFHVDPVNDNLVLAKRSMALLGLVAGGGAVLHYAAEKDDIIKPKPRTHSRRRFIGLLGAYLFFGNSGNTILGEMSPKLSITDVATYGTKDYRDIRIAEGAERVCGLDLGDVLCVHGESHSRNVDFYLDHPLIRKKLIAYAPLNAIASPTIKEFRPHGTRWGFIREF